jgi:hypothetical protein
MNILYTFVFLFSYLFMYFNNVYKINIHKINKYYNKVNYKLTIITTFYDFSFNHIVIFGIYLFCNEVIYFIFLFKLLFISNLIYENKNKINNNNKNIIYNITDFIIISTAVFVSEFSMMSVISSILLIFCDFKIY